MKVLFYMKRIHSSDRKKIIPFKKDEILVGRSVNCNYIITDPSVSRTHALFRKCGDGWILKNLSTSGLFLDKEELSTEEERNIKNGSVISFGRSGNFQYRFGVKALNGGDKSDEIIKRDSALDSQERELEEKLTKAEASRCALLNEKEELINILNKEKETLHNDFLAKEKALEKKLNDGILVEKTLMEEKEKLAEDLKYQVVEIKTKHEMTIKNLENKLKMEEDIKMLILKEKEDLATKFQIEKENLEKRLLQERKEVEETLVVERLKLQNQLTSLEEQRIILENKVKNNEQFLRIKEKEQENQQNVLLKEFESLKDEKEKLSCRLNEVESNLEEKVLLTSSLEGELKEKGKLDKKLESLIEDKKKLEEKLSEAAEKGAQVSELEESLKLLQAQKLSLEQEIQSVATVSKSAREEVVESVSNVLENEFQCSICSELFITAITLNCSHTFCKYCIDSWKKNKKECPNCRQRITSETRSIVLDNFIEKIVSTLSEVMKEMRNQVITERNAEIEAAKAREAQRIVVTEVATTTTGRGRGRNTRQNTRGQGRGRGRGRGRSFHSEPANRFPSSSRNSSVQRLPPTIITIPAANSSAANPSTANASAANPPTANPSTANPSTANPPTTRPARDPSPITIHSDSELSDDSLSHDSDDSASSYESGVSGVYYGGYGRCFNCGSRGHWANGCPNSY